MQIGRDYKSLSWRLFSGHVPWRAHEPLLTQEQARRPSLCISFRAGGKAAMQTLIIDSGLRRVVRLVALLNLAYFGIEFSVALAIGSVSLFADSVHFLEDASVNFLIFAALGWSLKHRARVGMALAGILLIPALATLWTAWEKVNVPVAPEPGLLTLTGAGACIVNFSCAYMLARYRTHAGSLDSVQLSCRRGMMCSPTLRLWRRALLRPSFGGRHGLT